VHPETGTSFDHYVDGLAGVASKLRRRRIGLALHAHPRIAAEVAAAAERMKLEFIESFAEVVERAHVYAVDNSSTLFEFAALDRPVVVLNAPHYRRDVHHGLRFWEAASVGVQVSGPAELASAIVGDPAAEPAQAAARAKALDLVYGVRDGTSTERAKAAIAHVQRHVR
jgi:CDP-glycerol glycerophosphotransferase (TagB/SpsB family)